MQAAETKQPMIAKLVSRKVCTRVARLGPMLPCARNWKLSREVVGLQVGELAKVALVP